MKRLLAFWLLTTAAVSAQPFLEMTSGPTTASHNTNYYIEARGWDSWGGLSVTVYKNGNYFASNYGMSPVSAGSNTSDAGPAYITYRIDGLNDYWQSDTIYHYVSVAAANNPPTIQWVTNPTHVYVGQNFTVQAKGMDSDGNLTNVFVWREWVPFAFNGGGNGYENTSDGNWHSQGSPGSITFQAASKDSNDAESSVIYHTVYIIKYDQTITFNQPAAQAFGTPLNLSASASSGLGVSFSVISGPGSLSGNTLSFTGVGSVVVRASQAGDGTYNAASNVDRTITVNQANQTITFDQPAAQTYGTPLNLSGSASSGLGVSFAVISGPGSLSGNTLSFTGVGSVVVRASQSGNANYNAASNVDRTITVNPANQTITFNQPAAQTVGDQLNLSATATSGLGVSFSILSGSGSASLSGNTLTFTAEGSVVVRASQAGNATYNAAANVDRTIAVDNTPPTAAWHTLPPAFIFPSDWFPVRATGSDVNGNLSVITVEYRVNSGSWVVLAYDSAGANGGNGYQTTSNNNSVSASTTGTTYQFRAQAYDTRGKASGWLTSGTYTVSPANTAPHTPQISARQQDGVTYNSGLGHYQMEVDGTLTIDASIADDESNLTSHGVWRIIAPPSDITWVLLNNGTGGQPNTTPTSGGSSTKTVTYVPVLPGRYDFHTNGQDSLSQASGGASITVWAYGPTNNAQFISQVLNSVTDPTTLSVNTGQTFSVSVTMRNTGDKPWTTASPHRLSAVDGLSTWGAAHTALPATPVYPHAQSGVNTTFSWTATAPTAPGVHTFQWRMKEEGVQWFGDTAPAVTVTVVDTIAPTIPASLQSTGKTTTTVSLSWSASTDNSGAVSYAIYRNGGGSPVDTTTGTTFTDTNLTHNTAYAYTVKAYDAAGNYSAASNTVNVTTDSDPNADDDGDGMPNGWETDNGLNPNDPNDALLDPDGDGFTNVAEFNRGTNPNSYDAGTSTLGGTIPGGWPNAPGGSSYAVGMTAGSLEVDKNGAAAYTIPLWAVPGTAGMEPKLALNYSSQSGSGWLGFGWSLSGLSAITRGPQTKAVDDNVIGVTFTASDRFYLDGQRLIAISGNYGENGTEYRTELDSISKIVSYGSAGTGPAYFKVQTKSGLTIEFGNTTNSAAEAQGRSEIMTWAVNRISDTKNNYIDFVYTENTSTGEHRIDRIDYTGNTGTSLSPYASVQFTYENRSDTFEGYVFGSKVSRTQRLKTIATYHGTTKVREYEFTYIERAHTGRSLLTVLKERASDNREYPPLTFEYDEAETGWNQLAESWGPPVPLAEHGAEPKGTGFIDLDGDGRPDFVQYQVSNTGTLIARGAWLNNPVSGWIVADGSGGSPDFRPPHPLARNGTVDTGARFVDINNDGLPDFMWGPMAYLNTGTGFAYSSTWSRPEPTITSGEMAAAEENLREVLMLTPHEQLNIDSVNYGGTNGDYIDVDGDGRPDFVGSLGHYAVMGNSGGVWATVYIYLGDGWRNTGSGWEHMPNYGGVNAKLNGFRFMDVNGDGRLDAVQHWYGSGTTTKRLYLGTGSGWANWGDSDSRIPPVLLNAGTSGNANAPVGTEAADLNGDGLVDIVAKNPNNPALDDAYLGTGVGWVSAPDFKIPYPINLANTNTPQGVALLDVNSDGLVDLVKAWWGETYEVRLGTGRGWSSNVSAYIPIRQLAQPNRPTVGTDFVDLDGDGAIDQVWNWVESGSPDAKGAALNKSKPADRLKKVTNGFGVAAQITYAPLTERDGSGGFTVYDKGSGGPADTTNVIGPLYVVKTVSNDDGTGGQHAVNYRYGGLRSHRLRGSLGFEWMQSTDTRTDIVSKTTFKQEYPYIGMVATTETKSGSTVLSSSVIEYDYLTTATSVKLPYAETVTQASNDLNGAAISASTTTTQIDAYGNATSIVVVDNLTSGFSKTTSSNYFTDADGTKRLGRLSDSSVASAAPGKATLTRTSSFTYHAPSGLLETETVEPGDNKLKITTTYGHDAYGNVDSVTVSGAAITVDANGNVTPGATVSRQTTYLYDNKGRFQEWKRVYKDANNYHQETYTHNQQLGVMESLTGPNGLATDWTYDTFGVKTGEERADSTVTAWTLRWAGSGAPAGSHTFVEVETSGAAPSLVFNDHFGRPLWALSINGDGTIIYQKTAYDNLGRAYAQSNPSSTHHASGYWADPFNTDTGNTVYWTRTAPYAYDALNRPAWVQTPDDNASHVTTSYNYNGRVTSVTDPLGRVARSTVNTQGWLTEAVRNDNGGADDRAVVTHDYDALGNLTTTTAHGATTTLVYDLRGRKIEMTEPNMGTWHYRYNIFGELIWQKDAKGQITTLAYDALGRLVSRTERNDADTANETTTWTYDSASAGGAWKGKLYSVSAPGGYSETHSYDSYGRPTTVTRTIDSANYALTQTYDSYSRPLKTVYPTGFQTRQVYNAFGYLKEVRQHVAGDDGKPNHQLSGYVYWMAESYAVTGQIDGEILGNGLINDRNYSEKTGRLKGAAVGRGIETTDPYSVQTLTYLRDAVGNIEDRIDTTAGVTRTESFTYDALDRLKSHTVNSGTPVTVNYDAQGNITSKSDVGTYLYGSGRPHAVSGVYGGPLGTQAYAYDANGNMVSGGGRTISWTSFNQVRTVTQGSYTSTFSFGAGRERVKQVSHLGTTIYVGALYEKFTAGSAFEHKHYIYAPTGRIAVHIERSDLSKAVRYFHTDGIGSITAVSNELGVVEKRFAFDAWGKRIDPGTGSTITGSTSGGFSRGFTDHEQLDDLGLVHMNGRVYDPVLGRFLSADPFVDSTGDSQSFNRYSYVSNNPLGYTDPSGYFKFKEVLPAIIGIVVAAVAIVTHQWYILKSTANFFGALGAGLKGASAIYGAAAGGFSSGFSGSLLNGGSIGDAFKAGVIGAAVGVATAWAAGQIGTFFDKLTGELAVGSFGNWGGRTVSHALVGGLASEAQGGQFRHGFYSSFASAGVMHIEGVQRFLGGDKGGAWIAARTATAATIGGTASALAGGKFANGAVTSAFQQLFNSEASAASSRAAWARLAQQYNISPKQLEALKNLGMTPEHYARIRRAGNSSSAADQALDSLRNAAAEKLPTIRNAHLAGKAHPRTGIQFDKDGFPDFSGVATHTTTIQQTGNRAGDFAAANRAAGLESTPRGFTWHHHQDGRTMQLVPTDIHRATGHTGGFSLGNGGN